MAITATLGTSDSLLGSIVPGLGADPSGDAGNTTSGSTITTHVLEFALLEASGVLVTTHVLELCAEESALTFTNADATIGLTWIEITTRTAGTFVFSDRPLPDPAFYFGGWKEERVLQWGKIRRALSGWDGQYETSDFIITLDDTDSLMRQLDLDDELLNATVVVRMITDEGRRLLQVPRVVFRGVIKDATPLGVLLYRITVKDIFAEKFSIQNDPKQVTDRLFTTDDFPACGKDTVACSAHDYVANGAGAIGEKGIKVKDGYGIFPAGTQVTFAGHSTTYIVNHANLSDPETAINFTSALTSVVADGEAITALEVHRVESALSKAVQAVYGFITDIHGSPDDGDGQGIPKFAGDRLMSDGKYWGEWVWAAHACAGAIPIPAVYLFNNPIEVGKFIVDRAGPSAKLTADGTTTLTLETNEDLPKDGTFRIGIGAETILVGSVTIVGAVTTFGALTRGIDGTTFVVHAAGDTVFLENIRVDIGALSTEAGTGGRIAIPGYDAYDTDLGFGSTTYQDYNGNWYTSMFLSGMWRDLALGIMAVPPDLGGVPLAICAYGAAVNSDGTGGVIRNVIQQYKHAIKNWFPPKGTPYRGGDWLSSPVFADDSSLPMIDESSFDIADAQSKVYLPPDGFRGDFIISADNERISARELLSRFNNSCGVRCSFNRDGQFFVTMLNTDLPSTALQATLDWINDIFDGTFKIDSRARELYNVIPYQHTKDYAGRSSDHGNWRGWMDSLSPLKDATSIGVYSGEFKSPELQFHMLRGKNRASDSDEYVDGTSTIAAVVALIMAQHRYLPHHPGLQTGPTGVNYELGQVVPITHFEGLPTSPGGWVDNPVQLERSEVDPSNYTTTVEGLDLNRVFNP